MKVIKGQKMAEKGQIKNFIKFISFVKKSWQLSNLENIENLYRIVRLQKNERLRLSNWRLNEKIVALRINAIIECLH